MKPRREPSPHFHDEVLTPVTLTADVYESARAYVDAHCPEDARALVLEALGMDLDACIARHPAGKGRS